MMLVLDRLVMIWQTLKLGWLEYLSPTDRLDDRGAADMKKPMPPKIMPMPMSKPMPMPGSSDKGKPMQPAKGQMGRIDKKD